MRGDTVGVREVARDDTHVAVLHTRVEPDAVATATQLLVERGDDGTALRARQVAGGEVDHDAVGVDGDEVASVRDLVGREVDAHRCSLDRRAPRVELGRVVPEDREVADVAPGRQTLRDHRRQAHVPARGEPREVGHRRGFERCATVELRERLVGASVGNQHEVLHRTNATRRRAARSRRNPVGTLARMVNVIARTRIALLLLVALSALFAVIPSTAGAQTPPLTLTPVVDLGGLTAFASPRR